MRFVFNFDTSPVDGGTNMEKGIKVVSNGEKQTLDPLNPGILESFTERARVRVGSLKRGFKENID